MKSAKHLWAVTFSLLICTALISVLCYRPAVAVEVIDTDRNVSLDISYQATIGEKTTALSGAKFHLYLVATSDEFGNLTATEAFSAYFADIRGENDEAWRAQATTLEGYVLRDKITATDSGKTDKDGKLSFPTNQDKLPVGLYLLLSDRHKQGNYRYDAAPCFVMLPAADKESNTLKYSAEISPKYDYAKVPGGGGGSSTVKRKVLKIWQDKGYEAKRPQEITVQLLRDGEIYDTVVLNDESEWRYSWDNLSDNYKWTLVEKATSGYTGTVTRDGITFVVTNTYTTPNGGTPPDGETPPSGGENPPTSGETPPSGSNNPPDDNNAPPNTPKDQPQEPNIPTLPQTGQLWWPIPIMLCIGLSLIITGIIRRRIVIGGRGNEK